MIQRLTATLKSLTVAVMKNLIESIRSRRRASRMTTSPPKKRLSDSVSSDQDVVSPSMNGDNSGSRDISLKAPESPEIQMSDVEIGDITLGDLAPYRNLFYKSNLNKKEISTKKAPS